MSKIIFALAALAFLATTANAQYDRHHQLKIPHQSAEDRENTLNQMGAYRLDQDQFRQQMESAAQSQHQQAIEHDQMEQLKDALRERLER